MAKRSLPWVRQIDEKQVCRYFLLQWWNLVMKMTCRSKTLSGLRVAERKSTMSAEAWQEAAGPRSWQKRQSYTWNRKKMSWEWGKAINPPNLPPVVYFLLRDCTTLQRSQTVSSIREPNVQKCEPKEDISYSSSTPGQEEGSHNELNLSAWSWTSSLENSEK